LAHRKAILEPLSIEFDFKGFHYRQIARKSRAAIYSQRWNGAESPSTAYEVMLIQAYPETTMFGKLVPAHEAMPGSEQWGQKGWTFTTEERARAKFQELTQQKGHQNHDYN
jgi:hypothetical protein